jgi:hypothetical protein
MGIRTLFLASVATMVMLASGVAWAATIRCDESRCEGTGGPRSSPRILPHL